MILIGKSGIIYFYPDEMRLDWQIFLPTQDLRYHTSLFCYPQMNSTFGSPVWSKVAQLSILSQVGHHLEVDVLKNKYYFNVLYRDTQSLTYYAMIQHNYWYWYLAFSNLYISRRSSFIIRSQEYLAITTPPFFTIFEPSRLNIVQPFFT